MTCDLSKSVLNCKQDRKPVPAFLDNYDSFFGLGMGSVYRTISTSIGSDLPILESCDSQTLVWLGHKEVTGSSQRVTTVMDTVPTFNYCTKCMGSPRIMHD